MLRTVLAIVAIAIGCATVAAETSPIKARQDLMKDNAKHAKAGAAMVKGEAKFDLAKAKEIFHDWAQNAEKFGKLFPENSKTGDKTEALPAIWEKMADFQAHVAKFAKDSKDAEASVKDLASFKAAFGTVTKNCGGCHEKFRAKKKS
jgi:cytochrome c556